MRVGDELVSSQYGQDLNCAENEGYRMDGCVIKGSDCADAMAQLVNLLP